VEFRRLTEGTGPLPYPDEVRALRRAKAGIATLGREEVFRRLIGMGIRKTHIERYLGKAVLGRRNPAAERHMHRNR